MENGKLSEPKSTGAFEVSKEIKFWINKGAVSLREVLPWCLSEHKVDTALVVSRDATKEGNKKVEESTRRIFGQKILKSFWATGWPGTELFQTNRKWASTGRVYVIRFDLETLEQILATENDLFQWNHVRAVPLPEDLCVFRNGSKYPAFYSVTHERDAYSLSDTPPPGFEAETWSESKWFVWDGPYFCRVLKGR